jgi:hypothetical protein
VQLHAAPMRASSPMGSIAVIDGPAADLVVDRSVGR